MSYTKEYVPNNFYSIDPRLLIPNPEQPRKYYDPEALEEMVKSVAQHGIINPITVTVSEGRVVIVAGERRWRASLINGLSEIPIKVVEQGKAAAISLAENLQREELSPLELAEGIFLLKKQHNYTLNEISLAIGKSVTGVSELLSLNRLPPDIRDECRKNKKYLLTRLIDIARAQDTKVMRRLFRAYKNELNMNSLEKKQRREASAVNNFIGRIRGIVPQVLKADMSIMSRSELCDCLLLFDALEQVMRKKAHDYR